MTWTRKAAVYPKPLTPPAPEPLSHDGDERQQRTEQDDAPVQVEPDQDEEQPEGQEPEPTTHRAIIMRAAGKTNPRSTWGGTGG